MTRTADRPRSSRRGIGGLTGNVAPRGRHEAVRGGHLAGTGLMARLALRRSRWFWLLWILALWAIMPATVSAYATLIPDPQTGAATVEALAANPTMRAMLGPPFDLLHAGGFTMWRVGTFAAGAAAMMGALGVIRATRAEEEDGRIELLRSGAIGRHAPLAGALVVALGACVVLAALITASMTAGAPPFTGALATGLGIGLTSALGAGLGALTAQVTESARTARGLALATIGVAYLVRALADGSPSGSPLASLGWLSPLQWAALTRPYAGERWWMLLLLAGLSALLVAVAVAVENRRDLGAGIRAARPGPARAPASLSSVGALVRRLERGTILGWALGMILFAAVIGSLAGTVDQMLTDNPQIADMFRRMGGGGEQLRDAFYVAMLGLLSVAIAFFAAQLVVQLRREEELGHVELLLSTATSRTQVALAHLLPALVAPTAVLVIGAAALGVPQAISTGDPALLLRLAGAGAALAPALWLVVGVAFALLGWAPRLTGLVWLVLGWSLFVTWIGALLGLPQTLVDATPFAPLPHLPVDELTWAPILLESALAAALVAVGLVGWRRRDILST